MDRKETFSRIYDDGIWNQNKPDVPKSGPGSSLANSKAFCAFLDSFCKERSITSIVDIGCGDLTWMPNTEAFRTCKYTGIDIVPSLIEAHKARYPSQTFLNLDAVTEEVPSGDLVIIRNVLFHLSLDHIQTVLQNIRNKFKYSILTSCNNTVNDDRLDQWHYHQINLTIAPFHLTRSICSLDEPVFNRRVLVFQNETFLKPEPPTLAISCPSAVSTAVTTTTVSDTDTGKARAVIPNILHFVYLMMDATVEFRFSYFLAVLSAYLVNNPEKVYLYVLREPHGEWWGKIRSFVTVELVELPTHWGSKPILKMAHKADYVRMIKLQERGGVYMDLDTISVRSYSHLLTYDTVLGKQLSDSICNAILFTTPKSLFFSEWIKRYESTFDPNGWSEASCNLPFTIYNELFSRNASVLLLDTPSFFPHSWENIGKIFVEDNPIDSETVTLHLWESWSKKYIIPMSLEWIRTNPCTLFGRIVHRLFESTPLLEYIHPIQIVVIGCNKERKRVLGQQFTELGITTPYTFFDGYTPATSKDYIVDRHPTLPEYDTTLCCMRSHAGALHHFLTHFPHKQYVLILEDDVSLLRTFETELSNVMELWGKHSADIDYVSLGYFPHAKGKHGSLSSDSVLNWGVDCANGVLWGTQAYLVKRSAAVSMVNVLHKPTSKALRESMAAFVREERHGAYYSRKDLRNQSDVMLSVGWRQGFVYPIMVIELPCESIIAPGTNNTARWENVFINGNRMKEDFYSLTPNKIAPAKTHTQAIGIITGDTSLFSNGLIQNAYFLYEVFTRLGHTCHLLSYNKSYTKLDYNDIPIRTLSEDDTVFRVSDYKMIITVAMGITESMYKKCKAVGVRVIGFICGNSLLMNLEDFKTSPPTGAVVGKERPVDELWVIEAFDYMKSYLELLRGAPVRLVPHLWSPRLLETVVIEKLKKPASALLYSPTIHTSKQIEIIVLEPNINVVKTALIPLMAAERVFLDAKELINEVYIFNYPVENKNAEAILGNLMVKGKVRKFKSLHIGDILTHFNAKDTMPVFVCHQLYTPWNYLYYELLYFGYPFIHNSPRLKEFGYYYNEFDIDGCARQVRLAHETHNRVAASKMARARAYLDTIDPLGEESGRSWKGLVADTGITKQSFDTILPLGFHCNISFLLKHLGLKKETTLFEWFQMNSLTAINETLQKINWVEPNTELIAQANRTEIKLGHNDIISSHYKVDDFKPIFVRRAKRFHDTIKTKNAVLFVRINIPNTHTSLAEIEQFRSIIQSLRGNTSNMKFMLISTILKEEEFIPIQHEWVIHRFILQSEVSDHFMKDDIHVQHKLKTFLEEAGFHASTESLGNEPEFSIL